MTLNAAILARLRNVEARFLKETCLIESETLVDNPASAVNHTRSTVASGVACRLVNVSQSVGIGQAVGSLATVDTFRLICPFGTDLAPGYIITIGSDEYQVVATIEARTDSTDAQAIVARSRAF